MKALVIYWSGTGVTEGIANDLKDILVASDVEADLFSVSEFSGDLNNYDLILLGCSAQGAEVIEEDEFEPFYLSAKPILLDKKVGLFGSYGWGDGEWMRSWQDDASASGITVACGEGLICQEDDVQYAQLEEYIKNIL